MVESPADAEESPDPENLGVKSPPTCSVSWSTRAMCWAWPGPLHHPHRPAALDRLPPCTVVQLTGVYDAGTADAVGEAVRRAAQVSGGDAHPIYAPMLLPDAATAAALRSQTGIARAFEYFDKVTVACVSIGSWEPGISTVHDMLTEEERAHYATLVSPPRSSAHLFDAEGRRVGRDLGERCITVEADRLRRIPRSWRSRADSARPPPSTRCCGPGSSPAW